MRKMQFSIKIQASRKKVWNTLWDDKTFRDWGNIIDEGQYMLGELKEGNKVQFISSVSGYGVTSLVKKLIPNKFVSFKQVSDTKDIGRKKREKEWTGGMESYSLMENDGITLNVEIDVPPGQEEIFKIRFPKALERIRILTEKKYKKHKETL